MFFCCCCCCLLACLLFYKTYLFCSSSCSRVDKGQDGRGQSPLEGTLPEALHCALSVKGACGRSLRITAAGPPVAARGRWARTTSQTGSVPRHVMPTNLAEAERKVGWGWGPPGRLGRRSGVERGECAAVLRPRRRGFCSYTELVGVVQDLQRNKHRGTGEALHY